MTPELTEDYDERSSLAGWRIAIAILATLIAASTFKLMAEDLIGAALVESMGLADAVRFGYAVTAAFWSVTLYDKVNGFFIPNEHKKYSVGENGGMKLDEKGGIEIYISFEKPEGVPAENWLPIERKDLALNTILRIYAPDLDKMKAWEAPKAERVGAE